MDELLEAMIEVTIDDLEKDAVDEVARSAQIITSETPEKQSGDHHCLDEAKTTSEEVSHDSARNSTSEEQSQDDFSDTSEVSSYQQIGRNKQELVNSDQKIESSTQSTA